MNNFLHYKMDQYLVTSYTFNNKLHLTNLISNYKVKELYSTKTLHIHDSIYLSRYYRRYQNINFKKLEKIKAKVIVYGNCYKMFYKSKFTGDISDWDVSSVTNMSDMFEKSQFNGVISDWGVSSVTNMSGMFCESQFTGVISDWDVSSVTNMSWMFGYSPFNGDISAWDVSPIADMEGMFCGTKFNGVIPNWEMFPDMEYLF